MREDGFFWLKFAFINQVTNMHEDGLLIQICIDQVTNTREDGSLIQICIDQVTNTREDGSLAQICIVQVTNMCGGGCLPPINQFEYSNQVFLSSILAFLRLKPGVSETQTRHFHFWGSK